MIYKNLNQLKKEMNNKKVVCTLLPSGTTVTGTIIFEKGNFYFYEENKNLLTFCSPLTKKFFTNERKESPKVFNMVIYEDVNDYSYHSAKFIEDGFTIHSLNGEFIYSLLK